MSKPIQTSYENKNGKKKLTITLDSEATVREAKKLAGKTADTLGNLASKGISKAKELMSKVPSVNVNVKSGKTEVPKTEKVPVKPVVKTTVKKPTVKKPTPKAKPVVPVQPKTEATK